MAQGSYDGAECAELVGLFILAKIAKITRLNPGIYRDDFLGVTCASPKATETMRNKIQDIFRQHGLQTTAEAINCKIVNFLDLTLNLKVSYSTTPNMEQVIAGKNAKVLNDKLNEIPSKKCSCTKGKECLLENRCLEKGIIYQATVEKENKESKTYVGLTATDFKARYGVHKKSFEDPDYNQTTLSKHIHDLKSKGIEHKVTWKILDRGTSYSPVSDVCHLCNKEAYYIIFEPHLAELNNRSELFSTCMHKKSNLLFKPKRGRPRKSPGT